MNGITETAKKEATTATIHKINRLLEQRIEAYDRAFQGDLQEASVIATVGLLSAIDGRFDYYLAHPEDAPQSLLKLARKSGFRFQFPQRMVELTIVPTDDANSNGLPDIIENRVAYPNARAYLIVLDQASASPTPNFEPSAGDIAALVQTRWAGGTCSVTVGGAAKSLTFAGHQNHNNGDTESSELLYYMLVAAGNFGSSSVDADQFSQVEIRDLDDDGLPEFVDAWDQPLRFYRWPTRLIDPTAPSVFAPDFATIDDVTEVDLVPDGSEADGLREILPWERLHASLLMRGLPPTPIAIGGIAQQRDMLLVDPDDPVGLLYSFIEDPSYKNLGIDLTQVLNEASYHTIDTYHVPLIVSAGPDEALGLREPNEFNAAAGIYGNLAQYAGTNALPGNQQPSAAVVDQLFDNLSNRNRRVGGKR